MEVIDELSCQVAIVGAGPAGSTLASLLARRGVDVIVIDRDVFPRDKLCGEFLSYDALPILDFMGITDGLNHARAPEITSCRVIGPRQIYEFALPSPARGISRLKLDQLLLENARRSGARSLAGWTVEALERHSDSIELRLRSRDQHSVLVRSKLTVGAWGRWGRFDRDLQRPFVSDRAHRHFGFKRHYRRKGETTSSVDLYSFDQGYLGVSSVEGGVTNICGLVHEKRMKGLKGGWESLVSDIRTERRELDEVFSRHEACQSDFLSSEPVIFLPRDPVSPGLLMVGDAAGLIDPLTGNGMAMASQSAALAVPHIMSVLGGANREIELQRYASAYRQLFHGRISWSRRVGWLLSRPSILYGTLSAIRTPSIAELILRRTRATEGEVEGILWRMKNGE